MIFHLPSAWLDVVKLQPGTTIIMRSVMAAFRLSKDTSLANDLTVNWSSKVPVRYRPNAASGG